jgi:hypothetical protein
MSKSPSFWTTVPRRSIVLFLLGVFFLFAVLGVVSDVMGMGRQPLRAFLPGVILSGLFAVGYALSGISLRNQFWKGFIPLFILQTLLMTWLANHFPAAAQSALAGPAAIDRLHSRLSLDGVEIIIAISLGYACFTYVTILEGRRYAQVHAEMRLAAEIHRVLVPAINQQLNGFEFYGRSFPSGEVGGDLIDVFGQDRNWVAYIADVSGHGVAPGLMMGMVKSAVRMQLSSVENSSALLERLNSVLYAIKKPEMFVTFAYLACHGNQLEHSLAGHPPILHFHDATRQVSEITCANLPVAMFSGRQFATGTLHCAPGDVFLLFTDGLLEVTNKQDEEFGLEALKSVFAQHAPGPLSTTLEAILDANNRHGLAADDRSLLLIRSEASAIVI